MADRLFNGLVWLGAALVGVVFLALLGDLLWQGLAHLSWSFLVSEPLSAGRAALPRFCCRRC